MADISKVVDYDATVPVKIFSDDEGDVIFHVRSIDNPDAQALYAKRRGAMLRSRAVKGEVAEEEASEFLLSALEPPVDILATCVKSWEWSGHYFGDLGKNPEPTPENVAETLRHKWIKDLVSPVAVNLRNFTKA